MEFIQNVPLADITFWMCLAEWWRRWISAVTLYRQLSSGIDDCAILLKARI